jgi:cell wall-associated NlpC family hydrolase
LQRLGALCIQGSTGQGFAAHCGRNQRPGDLVFYNTLRRGFSHVGIYLGDNKFIHSPSRGGQVRIDSMDLSYWKRRFNGARRIEGQGSSADTQ